MAESLRLIALEVGTKVESPLLSLKGVRQVTNIF